MGDVYDPDGKWLTTGDQTVAVCGPGVTWLRLGHVYLRVPLHPSYGSTLALEYWWRYKANRGHSRRTTTRTQVPRRARARREVLAAVVAQG